MSPGADTFGAGWWRLGPALPVESIAGEQHPRLVVGQGNVTRLFLVTTTFTSELLTHGLVHPRSRLP
jgi:hypothetical protein